MPGYNVGQTFQGHGVHVVRAKGEDLDSLFPAMCEVLNYNGPAAVIVERVMAPGMPDIECARLS